MIFNDRIDAARQLADALAAQRGSHPLVLAIPRGAVPMGAAIAEALEGELDVVLVHKLGSQWNPEYAVGAIDEQGRSIVTDPVHGGEDWLAREKARQFETLKRRRALYSPGLPPAVARDRVVIVVDDGLATGATMMAALRSLREDRPARLICAVPVAARSSLKAVEALADEVVCLYAPADFRAVGQFYGHFGQVEDEEVVAALARDRARRAAGKP
ncbi:phosphoribosyltransferase [Pseudothauera rhizosphaerae]|uniref:Phosphoribosyltransferase n=1 Tax=Pseudothauera rhizosphaerae TaxID=2565932 RepID=A0A4S4AVQ1_9RHOO|nr:phosphoribosyltransferase family protein [Pseudothauera rhizosphaerae]THF62626.1 phosphoribosyltransferase [Pseudothauera rhizosphaerae]